MTHFGPRVALAAWGSMVALTVAPTGAWAESARVTSLAGHRLIEDPTDVFVFPGLLFEHTDRLHLDFTPDAREGQGGLTFGDERIVGVHVGRGMARHHPRTLVPAGTLTPSDFEAFSSIITGQGVETTGEPQMMVDVLFGLPTGLGFRLSIANAITDVIVTEAAVAPGEGQEPAAANPGVCGQNETGAEFRTIELGAGWSQRTTDRSLDVGGAVSLHTVKKVSNGCLDAEAVGAPSVTAAARAALKMSERYELGLLAQLDVRDYSVEFSRLQGQVDRGVFALTVGAGPRVALGEGITAVATLVTGLAMEAGKDRIGENAPTLESSTTRFILPGVDLALEARWKDWLTARAGVLSRYVIAQGEQAQDGATTETLNTGAEQLMAAGIGVHWDRFALEGAFNVPLLTEGPDFVGGRAPGVFGELSMSYAWGGAETPKAAKPAAPAPAPERGFDSSPRPTDPPRYEPPPARPSYEPTSDPYWRPRPND